MIMKEPLSLQSYGFLAALSCGVAILAAFAAIVNAALKYLRCSYTEATACKRAESSEEIRLDHVKPFEPSFAWQTKQQTPYRPWHDGPYHVTMGIKKMDVEDWLDIDDTYLDKYNLKRRLFEQHRDEVLQILPGCTDDAFEALHLLKDVLVRRYPTMFRLRSPSVVENLVTGDVWDISPQASTWDKRHPLEVMSLLASEDFFLLQNDQSTGLTTLRAAASCFPAGFKIEERIGHSLWQIHAGKVPEYESKLAKSMDRFFLKMKTGSNVQRFNFAVDLSGELFHRHSHHNLRPEQLDEPPRLEALNLRVERQALQRLPKTQGILFSIRTFVTPITEVTKDRKVARALRTSVTSYSEDMSKYKNKILWEDLLLRHIAEILGEDRT